MLASAMTRQQRQIDTAIEPGRFRRKVFARWARTPYALVPAAAGAALLGAAAFVPATAVTAFAGVCGLLVGGGAYATRWIFGADDLARRAAEEMAEEERRLREGEVDRLLKRLLKDDDPRTQRLLRRLRDLHARIADPSTRDRIDAPANVVERVRATYDACLTTLARTADLIDSANRLTTSGARRQVMASREALVQEVSQAADDLERVVGQVEAMGVLGGDASELARMREELNRSLEVARRVEERVGRIERGLPDRVAE